MRLFLFLGLFTGLTSFAAAGLPDHLRVLDAFDNAPVVVLGWEHVRRSPVPRELIDQAPAMKEKGVQTLIIEAPSDYASDFLAGDFSYLLQTTSGARRYRVAQRYRDLGIPVMAGDVDERWLALNPLPLRKKDKSYKDVDERWMRMRNTRFVDVIQERLKAHPDGKVLLLVGSAHAALIGKIARERGVQARVIDVSERNFGKSYATRVLEGEDQTLDALAALEALDQSLDRELARLANTECWPKDRAERPWDVQKRLLAAQERAAVLAGPGGPHAARPLEIVIREVERLKQDFPAQVAEAERLAREGPPRGSFADFWNGMDASTADRLQKFARKVAQHAAIVRDQVQQAVPELAENAWTPVAQTEGIDISLRQIERSGRAVVQERVTRAGSSPKEVTLPDLDICSPA